MGTNFYARINACNYCGRSDDEIHIGKSSAGWTFSFHVTDEIKSYKDWIKYLSRDNIKIVDEYNSVYSLEEFEDLVESKKNEEHNHTKACMKSGYENSYLDEEGHSMTKEDFS